VHPPQHQQHHQHQHQHERYEDEEEDEIPGLVDEDLGNYGSETNLQHRTAPAWPRRYSEPYNHESDLEVDVDVGARPTTPPPTLPSLGHTDAYANADADANGHPNQPQPQPFFVLDWMLDDLVPEDRTAQDLAELLRETSAPGPAPAPASPMVQHLLPWLWNRIENNSVETADSSTMSQNQTVGRLVGAMTRLAFETPTKGQSHSASAAVNASSNESCVSPCTSPSFQSSDANAAVIDPSLVPPLPSTPKSSNRRACRIRQQLNPQRTEESSYDPGFRSEFLVPVNLDHKLRSEEHQEVDSIACSPPAQRRILFPSSAPPSPSPSPMWGGEAECNGISHNEQAPPPPRGNGSGSGSGSGNHVSPTGRSNSCPQFLDETTCDPEEQLRNQQQQRRRRRRQEQINRRERRNKLTIVQRSLTLAKGWNTKGLDMAGRATRAEDELAQALEEMGIDNGRGGSPEQLWESALECWDNALEVYRSLLGSSHERVADVQNNRGIALGKLRRYGEAREALGTVLDARKAQQRKRVAKEASKPGEGRGTGNNGNGNNNGNHHHYQSPRHSNEAAASTSAAIVSTLHNIANVHRLAGESRLALEALLEAQELLRSTNDEASSPSVECPEETHNRWLQLARVSTAIGHVCYESECWMDARDAYMEALQVYQQLSQAMPADSGDAEDRERLLQQWESIRCEVAALEDYLDELDRRQQAEAGSRTLLLRARREEQQHHHQRRWSRSPHRQGTSPHQPSEEQPSSTTKKLLGFVTHLRA